MCVCVRVYVIVVCSFCWTENMNYWLTQSGNWIPDIISVG